MDALQELNRKARALESAGHDDAALDFYLRAVGEHSGPARTQLLARAGLLQLRLGQVTEAAETLGEASELYARAGLRNNALALCERVLRADPERTDFLRRAAEISVAQGYPVDARRYRAELGGEEIASPAAPVPASPPAPDPGEVALGDDLGLVSVSGEEEAADAPLPSLVDEADEPEVAPLEGLEPTHSGGSDWGGESLGVIGSSFEMEETEEGAAPVDGDDLPLLSNDHPTDFVEELPSLLEEEPVEELPSLLDAEPEDALPTLERARPARELPPLVPDEEETVEELPTLASEAERELDEAGLAEARAAAAAAGDHGSAADYAARLAELRPDDFAILQLRAEHAFRSGDRERIVAAYLAVARRLRAMGQEEAARKIYARVVTLDPGNAEAREGARPPRAAEGEYVDFGALVLDNDDSARFQVAASYYPTGDEERDFHEILAAFREQISTGIDAQDSASHYDLGLAFKEMGLWDDAITQLQRALRAGATPVATLEVLGECYVEKGDPDTAARTLERALQLPGTADADLVGIHYWLARSHEARGAGEEARASYERVVEIDPRFRDAAARLAALGAG